MRTCFPINKVLYHLISTKVDSSQSHFIFLHFFWLSTWVAEIQKQKLQLAAIELFFSFQSGGWKAILKTNQICKINNFMRNTELLLNPSFQVPILQKKVSYSLLSAILCNMLWRRLRGPHNNINQFHVNVLFTYPQETSENYMFFDVFRGYRNRTLTQNWSNVKQSPVIRFGRVSSTMSNMNFWKKISIIDG